MNLLFIFHPSYSNCANFFTDFNDSVHFIGAQKCKECHIKEYESWVKTKHAKAFETLIKSSNQENPNCLRCHTTGFMRKGGYSIERKNEIMAGVQCESCHKERSEHISIKSDKQNSNECEDCSKPNMCIPCHNKTHSPNFKYYKYKKRILH